MHASCVLVSMSWYRRAIELFWKSLFAIVISDAILGVFTILLSFCNYIRTRRARTSLKVLRQIGVVAKLLGSLYLANLLSEYPCIFPLASNKRDGYS